MTCHLMLDIESLSTRVGGVVLSAAFVRFEDLASCSINLSVTDQQALGMEVDASTVEWWRAQPPEAWAAAASNPQPIAAALPYLTTWLQWAAAGRPLFIWCHGASFDAPLLGEVFRRAGLPCPWKYNEVRDTRTLYDLAGVDLKTYSHGMAHVALDDAICQTKAALDSLRILQDRREVAA